MPSFSIRLKELRKSKSLKQTDIADYLEFNIRTYQDYGYGNVTPNMIVLTKIADYFDVSLDYLTGRSDNPNRI